MVKDKLHNAEFLLTQSYPTFKDPKILLSVLDLLYEYVDDLLTEVLEYEYKYKRIPEFTYDFNHKMNLFKDRIAESLVIKEDITNDLKALKRLKTSSNNSLISITDTCLVIQSQQPESITSSKIKKILNSVKTFKGKVENEYGRII